MSTVFLVITSNHKATGYNNLSIILHVNSFTHSDSHSDQLLFFYDPL